MVPASGPRTTITAFGNLPGIDSPHEQPLHTHLPAPRPIRARSPVSAGAAESAGVAGRKGERGREGLLRQGPWVSFVTFPARQSTNTEEGQGELAVSFPLPYAADMPTEFHESKDAVGVSGEMR